MKPLEDKDKVELLNELSKANKILKEKQREIETLQQEVWNAVIQVCTNQGTTLTKRYISALTNKIKQNDNQRQDDKRHNNRDS